MPRKKKKKRKTKTYKATVSSSVEITEPTTNTSTISQSNSPQPTNTKTKSKTKTKTKSTKLSKKPKDPNKPKQSQSSYLLFTNDIRESFKQQHPNKTMPQLSKLIGSKWKQMSIEQKKPYIDKAKLLRQEYKQKLIEYQKSQSYKDYQQTLEQWKQSQSQNKTNSPIHKSNTNTSKRTQKRGKKRKRSKNGTNYASDSSNASLSSVFSDNNQITKRRKITNTNNRFNDSDISSELSEGFEGINLVNHLNNNKNNEEINSNVAIGNIQLTIGNYLTIADAIKDDKHGKEMQSTIKQRQLKRKLQREKRIKLSCHNNNKNSDSDHSDAMNEDENKNQNDEEKKENILKCSMCERIFEQMDLWIEHEKKVHTKQCKFCNLSFQTDSRLEEHIYDQHDNIFGDNMDVNDDYNQMRIDENGNFKLNDSRAKQRFIYSRSRYRQQQRIKHQMNKMKKRVVIQENNGNGKDIIYKKREKRINTQSFIKTKRNNIGMTYGWKPHETKRFYKVLKYTGLNFTFMETIYNKAIMMDKNSKWIYRDAKSIKKKYEREGKDNSDKITDICRNFIFTMGVSDTIGNAVKKNEYKLKDEKYLIDSDIEMDENKNEKGEELEEESEEEFNPFMGYKEEIEMDMECDKERKRKEMMKLEEWREKKEKSMSGALDKFKKEQKDYRKYKAIKEQSITVGDGDEMKNEKDVYEGLEKNKNIRNVMEEDENEGDDESGFDPFDILSDKDSDDGVKVKGYESDRSVSKNNYGRCAKSDMYGNGNDGGYEYNDAYDNGYDNVQDFDLDGDPFG